jgi:precorrin-6A/cobalt-precorrin-6A reductase
MKQKPHLLILGGTSEAYRLAQSLAQPPAHSASESIPLRPLRLTTSLAGRTAQPRQPAGALRQGGFGGVAGMVAYLIAEQVSAVVDATHPFAQTIGQNAAVACAQAGVPLLRLDRPAWHPIPGDRWFPVATWADALQMITDLALRRPFLAIGRNELAAFANQPQARFVIRAVDDPGQTEASFQQAFPQATVILGRGPFALAEEQALLTQQGCDGVICKNAGGTAGAAKLAAARALGLPVILLTRPPRPPGATVQTLPEAERWIRDVLVRR